MSTLRIGIILILCALALQLLVGCAGTAALRTVNTVPVCKALIGPIKYNTVKPDSRRHAGLDLAADLKRRNQVGENLRCPAYR